VPFLTWIDAFTAPWREVGGLRDDVARHSRELKDLRIAMANTEQYAARIDAATSEVAADLQSVKEALGKANDPANPVPNPEPETPAEPTPGEPESPGDSVPSGDESA
jgi:hypothetical protein